MFKIQKKIIYAVEAVIDDDAARDFSVLAGSKLPPKYGIENVMRQYTQIIYG